MPIPTLSDRQFVLTKSNLSEPDQQLQRELFWYREELFNIVRGRWCEVNGCLNQCEQLTQFFLVRRDTFGGTLLEKAEDDIINARGN